MRGKAPDPYQPRATSWEAVRTGNEGCRPKLMGGSGAALSSFFMLRSTQLDLTGLDWVGLGATGPDFNRRWTQMNADGKRPTRLLPVGRASPRAGRRSGTCNPQILVPPEVQFPIFDWRLAIGDWSLAIGNLKSEISNLQSSGPQHPEYWFDQL